MAADRWDEIDRVWHAIFERPESERSAAIDELAETMRRCATTSCRSGPFQSGARAPEEQP